MCELIQRLAFERRGRSQAICYSAQLLSLRGESFTRNGSDVARRAADGWVRNDFHDDQVVPFEVQFMLFQE
jgi:hypothetical protein